MNGEVDQTINHGYYRIDVSADNAESFIEARFYETKIDVSKISNWDEILEDDKNTKELSVRKMRGLHTILVRDYIPGPKEEKNIVRIKAQEILDPIARTYLGNYAEFWAPVEKSVETRGTEEVAQKQSCGAENMVSSSPDGKSAPSSKDDLPSKKKKEEPDKILPAGAEGDNLHSIERVESDVGGATSKIVVAERCEKKDSSKSCDVEGEVPSASEWASIPASKGDSPHKEKDVRDGDLPANPEVDERGSTKSGTSVQHKTLGCICCWFGRLNSLISRAKNAMRPFVNNKNKKSQANIPVLRKIITYRAKQIDPPHQLPIINGRIIRVHGRRGREVAIRVHDLKLGEFSYNADRVVIHGVDLRVQGNKINLNGNALHVEGFKRKWDKAHRESSEDAEFVLIVKGSAMRIDGVRADNIEAIRISDDCELKAVIEEPSKKEVKKETNRATLKSIGYSFKFFILLGALVWLTFLPFCKEGYFREKYDELIRRVPAPVVEVMKKPAELLNKICIQVSSSGGDANQVTTTTNAHPTTESSEAKQENTTNGAGGGVVTFYFVLACLLYVALYAIVVFVAVAAFKAMRRHNKMTRNMSSVIEALRNERDKEKRREMQKKILDDMINTYLERPSAED